MNDAIKFCNLMTITNEDIALREEAVESFRDNIVCNVEINTSFMIMFKDNSLVISLDTKLFAFNVVEEYEELRGKMLKLFPEEMDELFSEINRRIGEPNVRN